MHEAGDLHPFGLPITTDGLCGLEKVLDLGELGLDRGSGNGSKGRGKESADIRLQIGRMRTQTRTRPCLSGGECSHRGRTRPRGC